MATSIKGGECQPMLTHHAPSANDTLVLWVPTKRQLTYGTLYLDVPQIKLSINDGWCCKHHPQRLMENTYLTPRVSGDEGFCHSKLERKKHVVHQDNAPPPRRKRVPRHWMKDWEHKQKRKGQTHMNVRPRKTTSIMDTLVWNTFPTAENEHQQTFIRQWVKRTR